MLQIVIFTYAYIWLRDIFSSTFNIIDQYVKSFLK